MMGNGSKRVHGAHRPIGIFDSGVGGLSVWRAVVGLLPAESTIYLADQAHVPYGDRPRHEIEALTHDAAAWFFAQDVKLLVIACNTASAAALTGLRERWPSLPIVGMEPAVKPASARTTTGRVGVMATPGTLEAERFNSLVERFATGVEVHTVVCPGLVQMVEAGQGEEAGVDGYLHELLDPLVAEGIDHLVLGCTHYPFLAPAIRRVLGDRVTLVDPAPAVARQVRRLLADHDLLAPPSALPRHRFYTTGNAEVFSGQIMRLVGVAEPAAESLTFDTLPRK